MTVYLNGQFIPLEEARISVLDRGFIFGDGVYEVIPVYSRRAFRLAEHLRRLQYSLDGIRLANPHSNAEWKMLIDELIECNAGDDQSLYLHITRGVARRDHAFPSPPVPPTLFMMSNPLPTPPAELLQSGVCAVTAQDNRWLHCDIKSVSLLGNVLAAQNAAEHGAIETIQFRDGFLTEASASNVWIVKNGTLLGPRKNNLVLEGIRYGLFEELCAKHAIPFETRSITREEVFAADEVLLSSATKEVLPVTQIDGKQVGQGKPGPLYARLYELYQKEKAQQCQ